MKAGKNAIKVLNNSYPHDVKRERGGTGKNAKSTASEGKECDELKDQCLALRLDNDGLRYIMLCQDCRRYLDNKRPGDTVEGYSCPSCIGLMGSSRNF